MTPALDRDELAARFAVALACGDIASDQPERAPVDVVAIRAFEYADAFLAESPKSSAPALSPPAAVAPAKYEPKVGDVVRVTRPPQDGEWSCFLDEYEVQPEREGIVVPPDAYLSGFDKVPVVRVSGAHAKDPHGVEACRLAFVRPATPAERAAAGLPVEPAPEASHSSPGGGTSQVGGAAERDAGIVTPASSTPAPEAKRPEWGHVLPMRDLIASTIYNALGGSGGFDSLLPDSRHAYLDAADAVLDVLPPTPPAPSRKDALAMALREVRRMVEGGVYRTPITTYIDAALSRPAATKGGA